MSNLHWYEKKNMCVSAWFQSEWWCKINWSPGKTDNWSIVRNLCSVYSALDEIFSCHWVYKSNELQTKDTIFLEKGWLAFFNDAMYSNCFNFWVEKVKNRRYDWRTKRYPCIILFILPLLAIEKYYLSRNKV